MKIGVAQIDTPSENVESNILKIREYAKLAKQKKCKIVVLPEMIDTGYDLTKVEKDASSWDEKPFKTACKAALDNQIHIVCNLSEKTDSKIFNTTAVIDDKGKLAAKYRKIHLADYPPLNEGRYIAPGTRLVTVKIGSITFGLLICYDLRFPEMNRALALSGAKALIMCSAWPFPRLRHFNTLIKARAIENQVYFIASNRVGNEGPVTFCGSSRIIDPFGVTVASAAEEREALITGEIDESIIETVRSKMPLFEHRQDVDRQKL